MKFAFGDAPEWFRDHVLNYYTEELHNIQKAAKTIPDHNDQKFKEIAVDYFRNKGFDAWLDQENHLWFDVDPDSVKWTFEILKN
jgi:hypothetical protein